VADLLKVITRGMGFGYVPTPRPVIGNEGWFRVTEPFAGAWQRGLEVRTETSLANPVVFRCATMIASDFAKLRLVLKVKDRHGIWTETESPAFSPVLRKPNRYQTRQQFLENWQLSKQLHGNAYALKERDNRGVVVALYVLDPSRVKPLAAPDGGVYYQVSADNLAGVGEQVVVPAREVVHDRFHTLFHPLCGISPLYAAGLAAAQGQEIARTSALFFKNGSTPGGVLTHPEEISEDTAKEHKRRWEELYSGPNVGRVAVLGNGLTYQPFTHNAVDSQLVEQLKATDERICTAFGVPAHMVGVGPQQMASNAEIQTQAYYSQLLQSLIEAAEALLDEGLGLPNDLGVEFDLSGLLRMDQATQAKALAELVGAGIMAPNEARQRLDLKPVRGGASPLAQQQNYSLEALAKRDAKPDPFATGAEPAQPAAPADDQKTFAEKARPVLAGFAAELADQADRQTKEFQKRLAKLEAAQEAGRAQINAVVKALPSARKA